MIIQFTDQLYSLCEIELVQIILNLLCRSYLCFIRTLISSLFLFRWRRAHSFHLALNFDQLFVYLGQILFVVHNKLLKILIELLVLLIFSLVFLLSFWFHHYLLLLNGVFLFMRWNLISLIFEICLFEGRYTLWWLKITFEIC